MQNYNVLNDARSGTVSSWRVNNWYGKRNICKTLLKEKRQTFTFSAQVDYFKIKLRKLDLLKRC